MRAASQPPKVMAYPMSITTHDGEQHAVEGEPMIVATTETIVGQRIVATIGQVLGLAVRTRGIESNIMVKLAHFPAVDDDAMAEFVASLLVARDEAIARMVTQATECGASAVVGVRFDCAAVGR